MSTRLKRAPKGIPEVLRFPSGPFVGMRDSVDPTAASNGLAKMLRNVYPEAPQFGGSTVHRPGYLAIDGGAFTQGPVQCFHQFTKLDGTEITIAVVYGEIWRYDWLGSAWVRAVSSSLVTQSPTSVWHAVTFNDKVVFCDGHNSLFTWDGTDGGGVSLLSGPGTETAYGPLAVHYGKLFFVKNSERSTITWSEENQPNVGYEDTGYSNAWTLLQTDTNHIERILPTNELMYVFRHRSITAISGEVNENFASTGTREAVSSNIGTRSFDSVFFGGDDGELIFFADADGRPHVMAVGGSPVPIWMDARNTLRGLDPRGFDAIQGYWDPLTEHAVFCYRLPGETRLSTMLRYHVKGGKPQLACVWDGYDIARVGVLEDHRGVPIIMHGQYTVSGGAFPVYAHQAPGALPLSDAAAVTVEDSYAPVANNAMTLDATTSAYGHSFTASTDGWLTGATFDLYRDTGATGSLRAKLYALTGSHGTTAVPTGTALATSGVTAVSDLIDTSYGASVAFVFSEGYRLVAGTTYVIVVEAYNLSADVFIAQVAAGAHAGNSSSYNAITGLWSAFTSHDFAFSVSTSSGVVVREVETHPQPYNESVETHYDRLDLMVRSRHEVQALTAQTRTVHGISTPTAVTFEPGISLWDEASWGDPWDYTEATRHGVVGVDAWGSSCGILLSQEGVGLSFSLLTLSLQGRMVGRDVGAR